MFLLGSYSLQKQLENCAKVQRLSASVVSFPFLEISVSSFLLLNAWKQLPYLFVWLFKIFSFGRRANFIPVILYCLVNEASINMLISQNC